MSDTSDLPSSPPQNTPQTAARKGLKRAGLIVAVAAIAIVAVGVYQRQHTVSTLEAEAQTLATPTVSVLRPKKAGEGRALTLPGTVEAINAAAIHARTNGYVARWMADIGDRVHKGQVLAALDAPELEQQLAQAKADYGSAVARRDLARTSAVRWTAMAARDAVSKQEMDERNGEYASQRALTVSALANVHRLEALRGFTQIRAPFDGIVTTRSAQLGALVTSGNAQEGPLFTVADISRMLVYVRVPQAYARSVKPGTQAELTLPEIPGQTFTATVRRTARAIDRQSGSTLFQLEAANPDEQLSPGAYAQVRFDVDSGAGNLQIPGSAVLYRAGGPAIAVVGRDGRVTVRPITIVRDEGRDLTISSGLAETDQVIDAPYDSIATGDRVRIQQAKTAARPAK